MKKITLYSNFKTVLCVLIFCFLCYFLNWRKVKLTFFRCTVLWVLTHEQTDVTTVTIRIQNSSITSKSCLCYPLRSPPPFLTPDNHWSTLHYYNLRMSYTWDQTVCNLLSLNYFTWHNAFEIHPSCLASIIDFFVL